MRPIARVLFIVGFLMAMVYSIFIVFKNFTGHSVTSLDNFNMLFSAVFMIGGIGIEQLRKK